MKIKGSYWLKSGAYTFLERFALQLFRFGSFFLLVRGLTRQLFGIWTIFLLVTSIIEMLRFGLIQNALVKYISTQEDPKVRGRINTASIILNLAVTLLTSIVVFILAQVADKAFQVHVLDQILYLFIFTNVALIPLVQMQVIQQANLDFKAIFLSNLLRTGIFFGYVLYVYLDPNQAFSLMLLAVAQVIAAIASSILSIILGRKYLNFSGKLDRDWLKELFWYGKFVLGTNIASMLNKSIDQLMLGLIINPVATAVYGTAIKIANLIEVPTQSVAAIVFPKSAQRAEKEGKGSVKGLYEKSVGVILAVIIPGILFVLLFPEFVLQVVAGDKYMDAVPLLRLTMLYGLLIPFARQFGVIMDSMGKPQINFMMVVASAALNVVFNFFFISQFGIIGAAYATLTTLCLLFIANQYILYKEIGSNPLNAILYSQKVYANGFRLLWNKLVIRDKTSIPSSILPTTKSEPDAQQGS